MSPETACARRAFFRIYPSIVLPLFIAVGEQTIISSALPIVVVSLGGAERISWVVLAYLAANTIGAPIHGMLGDRFGRRQMLIAGLLVYIASAFACIFAPSIEGLALLRVAQGLGGAGLLTASLGLLGDHLPPRERGRFEPYLVMVILSAATLSPILGGLLAKTFGWQSIFAYGVIMGTLALVLALRLPRSERAASAAGTDLAGMALFVVFVGCLIVGLENLRPPLTQPAVSAALMLIAACALIGFFRVELRVATPFMNIALLTHPVIWRLNSLAAFHGAAALGLIVTLPMLMRIGMGWDVVDAGILLVVMNLGSAIGSVAVGRVIARTGRTLLLPTLCMGACGALFGYLAFRSTHATFPELVGTLVLIGFCFGTTMAPVQMAAQTAAGRQSIGAATGLVVFSRSMGASLGLTAATATLFGVLALMSPLALGAFEGLIRQGPAALDLLTPADRAEVLAAVTAAIRGVYGVVAAFALMASLMSWMNPMQRV
jgi:MFS family permease